MKNKTYYGIRNNPSEGTVSDVTVTVKDDRGWKTFTPDASQKIYNHSPTGFSWGYEGSGPAQLALAILLDHTGDQAKAVMFYQRFKRHVVAGWGDEWSISSAQVQEMIEKLAQDDARSSAAP